MKKIIFALTTASLLIGCTDATIGKLTSLGDSATVKCWSGGTLIFDGKSSGKVQSEKSSDGYFFKDIKDGKFKEVSGNCVITYD